MFITSIGAVQSTDILLPAHDASRQDRTETKKIPQVILHPDDERRFTVYDRSGSITTPHKDKSDKEDASSELDKSGSEDLSAAEENEVRELQETDRKVRAHENAHMAAGAGLVRGSASYEYKQGPDGKLYAVGGEVSIDTSKEQNPEDTVRKMQRVKAAALAPADPSPQDRKIAMQAAMKAAMAQIEVAEKRTLEKEQAQPQETDGDKHLERGVRNYLKTTQEHAVGTCISTRT